MTAIANRFDLVLLFDCADGNPNGDPDAGNMPRTDPETLQGLVSDVCQKRKVRDWVYQAKASAGQPALGYDILFGHSGLPQRQVIQPQLAEAHEASLSADEKKQLGKANAKEAAKLRDEFAKGHANDARSRLCASRFDVRTFGAVLAHKERNAGQVRGPVQCTFARSIDPVLSLEACITRKSVTNQDDADEQMAKDGAVTGTMGRKNLIPYGLYRSAWFVSPMLATNTAADGTELGTGFSQEDFKVLCEALLRMWELDRSAARGMMATRALVAFRHDSALGNAPAHRLLERVKVQRVDPAKPPRAFGDYRLEIDRSGLPAGVACFDLAEPAEWKACFGG